MRGADEIVIKFKDNSSLKINTDSLKLIQFQNVTGINTEISNRQIFSRTYPNPFNSIINLEFHLQNDLNNPERKAAKVSLDIFSVNKQLVRTLEDFKLENEKISFIWDGRDFSGNTLSDGIYFYKLRLDKFQFFGNIVLIK